MDKATEVERCHLTITADIRQVSTSQFITKKSFEIEIYKRFGRHVWHNRHANTALREREVGTAQCSVSRFAHSTQREIITWRTRPRPASATLCRQTSFHRLAARFRSYFYTIRPFAPFVTALQNKFI